MMKSYSYIIILFILFLSSCSAWKASLVSSGDQNDAVRNAITDFLHTEKLSKQDSVFSVSIDTVNSEILGIGILGYEDKLILHPDNKIGASDPSFPTKYIEKENRLFYWYDPTSSITNDLMSVLLRYNKIDSSYVKGNYELSVRFDDSKRGVDYYFCKNNLVKYKKVVTSIAMGYYDPPKLKCGSSD